MIVKFTLTTDRAKEKVVNFVGEENVMRSDPFVGAEKHSVEIILNSLMIASEQNSLVLINTASSDTCYLLPTEYLVCKIF